jgi:predicted esterase
VDEPQTDLEKEMARLWSNMLHVELNKIGRFSTFFEVGGDSISASQLVKEIQLLSIKRLGYPAEITVKDIYRYRTIHDISAHLVKENIQNVLRDPASKASLRSMESMEFDVLHTTKQIAKKELQGHIKIVCLHGQGTNPYIFRDQLSAVMKVLGSTTEFHFIQAPMERSDSPLEHLYDQKWYQWWPSMFITKSHIEKSIDTVVEELQQIGHFDALLGFSQGASMVELLDRLSEQGLVPKLWNFSILISGTPLQSLLLSKKYQKAVRIETPSIHVMGVKERKRLKTKLVDRYRVQVRELLEHEKGHEIPHSKEFTRSFAEKILRMALNERRRESMDGPVSSVVDLRAYQ